MLTLFKCTCKRRGLSEFPTLQDSCTRLTAVAKDAFKLVNAPRKCILAAAPHRLCCCLVRAGSKVNAVVHSHTTVNDKEQ